MFTFYLYKDVFVFFFIYFLVIQHVLIVIILKMLIDHNDNKKYSDYFVWASSSKNLRMQGVKV